MVAVPFDPDTVWGAKRRHHIHGTVNQMPVRGVVEPAADRYGNTRPDLAAWLRPGRGDTVTVHIGPEGRSAAPRRRCGHCPGRKSAGDAGLLALALSGRLERAATAAGALLILGERYVAPAASR
jgi:hypothetical protein